MESMNLDFEDKLEIVIQRIYQNKTVNPFAAPHPEPYVQIPQTRSFSQKTDWFPVPGGHPLSVRP